VSLYVFPLQNSARRCPKIAGALPDIFPSLRAGRIKAGARTHLQLLEFAK